MRHIAPSKQVAVKAILYHWVNLHNVAGAYQLYPVFILRVKTDTLQRFCHHGVTEMVKRHFFYGVFPSGFPDEIRQKIRRDAYIVHIGAVSVFAPRSPWGFYPGQGLAVCADPCVIDIIALVSFAKMQVYRRPVVHFGVINAHSAAPASHIRQGVVRCPDVFVVCDRDFLRAVPDAHAFCDKIAVLLRALFPVAVFIVDLLHQMRKIGQGRVCHAPVFRVVHLVLGVQAADKRQKALIRFTLKQNAPPSGKVIIQRAI